MELFDAMEILLEHRPDRPRSTDRRQLQQAIDVILDTLDNIINARVANTEDKEE